MISALSPFGYEQYPELSSSATTSFVAFHLSSTTIIVPFYDFDPIMVASKIMEKLGKPGPNQCMSCESSLGRRPHGIMAKYLSFQLPRSDKPGSRQHMELSSYGRICLYDSSMIEYCLS